MPADAVAALQRALGAPPPAGIVDHLSSGDLEHLASLIDSTRRSQAEELRSAAEAGLNHIPFPLRIALKKVLR